MILLADLGPVAQLRAGRLSRRLTQLLVGLWLYGISIALMVRGNLGVAPWDVLHSGLTRHLPLSLGQALVLTSFVVLLGWIPLREKPGVGTIANAVLIGVSSDVTLGILGTPDMLAVRVLFTAGGVVLCGVSTALYIGAQLGRGPRDGLMTGLHRRTGLSLRTVRTGLEVAVAGFGFALGGSLGAGSVLFALSIGPAAQALLPWVVVRLDLAAKPLSPARARPQGGDVAANARAS